MCTLRRRNKGEEYHTGKTTDLRNVIAEIQKVDQETADLSGVVQEAQNVDRRMTERRDSVATCRVLFYTVFDKIFLICLFLGFIVCTYLNFRGNIFSGTYGYWRRIFYELGIILSFGILSFLFNWIYNCIVKTMLCVTPHMIYKESYFPFWRKEVSIPLSHVTSISTVTFLWIFRSVMIHRYHQFPLIFFTWNHDKFKNKVDELLGNDVYFANAYQNRGIFQRRDLPFIKWIFILLCMFLVVLGIVHLFGYLFSTERSISGTYKNGNQYIQLRVNKTCDMKVNRIHDLINCGWEYDEEHQTIELEYEYTKNNYFGNEYTKKDTMSVSYKEDSITFNGVEYKKS